MLREWFTDIFDEFPREFDGLKGLAEELRAVLLPSDDGTIFTGTPDDPGGCIQ